MAEDCRTTVFALGWGGEVRESMKAKCDDVCWSVSAIILMWKAFMVFPWKVTKIRSWEEFSTPTQLKCREGVEGFQTPVNRPTSACAGASRVVATVQPHKQQDRPWERHWNLSYNNKNLNSWANWAIISFQMEWNDNKCKTHANARSMKKKKSKPERVSDENSCDS